jgi:UDP-GlcNAc:undecaprenyl-phosphate GlcNAc-1-phosphate transferase
MGDSGALLLGFVLATESVQGLLKTAVLATLVLPLLVLAIPIIDTSFVIAKRLKYRQPLWLGDRTHLHHRFVDIGFSQRRAVVYLYAWCCTLAAAALGTRFLRPHANGVWHLWPTVGATLVGLAAVGSSIYIAYLLEIVKLANPRIRRREEDARAARKSA